MSRYCLFVLTVLVFISGCKKEPAFLESLEGDLIVCPKNQHICFGILDVPERRESITDDFTFQDGTNYQNYWTTPYAQVNKLFGVTDCGDWIQNRDNSVMVGFRHLPGTEEIEILGYVHRQDAYRNGVNFRHASLALIPRYQKMRVTIGVLGGYYRFTADGHSELVMKRYCSDSTFKGRKISPWFGGQKVAPVTLKIEHQANQGRKSEFPKTLQIMDQDDLCSKGLNPLNYLKNHDSGIYSKLESECAGTLRVQGMGCNSKRSDGSLSENSDPGLRYEVSCI